MEGIILDGISIGMAVVGVLILGAVVTGVFLLWMSDEEKAGASFPSPGCPPLPAHPRKSVSRPC